MVMPSAPSSRSSLQWDRIRARLPYCQSYGIFTMKMMVVVMVMMKIVMMVSLTLLELKCEYMAIVNLLQAEGDI